MSPLSRLAACAALFLALARPVAADEAVVVGLDRYPTLRPDAALSGGVNDAKLLAARLERAGFHVTLLTDTAATRAGILASLAAAGTRNKPDERFVFYFAGHGTGGAAPYLLPYDSVEGSFDHDLSARDVNEAVKAVPASRRTVILDTCFSKLFATSRGLGTARRTRYYSKVASRGLAPVDASATRPDSTAYLAEAPPRVTATRLEPDVPSLPIAAGRPAEEVCYFVASRQNEPAQEDEFGGQVHGVFSYYLASRLLSNRLLWSDLQSEVGSLVAERTDDTQHPTLTAGFSGDLVFGGPPRAGSGSVSDMGSGSSPGSTSGVSPSAPSGSVSGVASGAPSGSARPSDPPAPAVGQASDAWAAFNRDRVDPGRLDLTMRPSRSTLAVGDLLSFTIRCGMEGYLVVAERGVSGNVNLLYPRTPDVDQARVSIGEAVSIPDPGKAYSPDRPGTERVRALLFGSRMEAAAFLAAFHSAPADFPSFVTAMKTRDLRLVNVTARDMGGGTYTADVFFQVLPR